jgi:hypothetical protein
VFVSVTMRVCCPVASLTSGPSAARTCDERHRLPTAVTRVLPQAVDTSSRVKAVATDTRLGQLAVDPASSAVGAAAHTAVEETDEDGVGIAGVNGEAPRAASGQGELDRPRLACFVESSEGIAGCGVEARHLGQLILR